jgi:hypothetical protein
VSAQRILEYVEEYIGKSGYLYNDWKQIRIISGQELGFYSWIAANYLENNFGSVSV